MFVSENYINELNLYVLDESVLSFVRDLKNFIKNLSKKFGAFAKYMSSLELIKITTKYVKSFSKNLGIALINGEIKTAFSLVRTNAKEYNKEIYGVLKGAGVVGKALFGALFIATLVFCTLFIMALVIYTPVGISIGIVYMLLHDIYNKIGRVITGAANTKDLVVSVKKSIGGDKEEYKSLIQKLRYGFGGSVMSAVNSNVSAMNGIEGMILGLVVDRVKPFFEKSKISENFEDKL